MNASQPALILIEQSELDALAEFGRKCQGVLVSCTARVDGLEAYASEADKQIATLSQSLTEEQAKPKMKFLYFVPPILVGLVLGFVLSR